ncbi:MAG TPA: YegS/Rv2252/BmrU family lipid kinase [Crocinitomicaceae bacterium]|nr:YegS/Rv2252/BmrU family lipid kinase [Crocinitomicaceae bacterium]
MSVKKRIRFIINPISGIGKKNQLPDLIETFLDHDKYEYEIQLTEYRKHARQIAINSSKEGFDIVCAVGGDGSVHEVGTGLINTNTTLAIIPTGSGNGLARHLKIPLEIIQSIECINDGFTSKIDTVTANGTPFLGFGGFGFDAVVAKRFDEYHKRGFSSYIKLVFQEFFKYKAKETVITLDNKIIRGDYFLCSIANSSELGNGFCLSPKSQLDDGKAELCLLKPVSFWSVPKLVLDFFTSKAHTNKNIEIHAFSTAKIQIKDSIAHFDGEPFEMANDIEIAIKSKSLNILVGKKYHEIHRN